MTRVTRGSVARALLAETPDELWVVHILSLLPPDALIRLGACARRWRVLIRHESLWRRISLAGA
jgi:hypothetical protein